MKNREIKFRAWNKIENKMHYNCGINPHGKSYRIFDEDGACLDWYGSQPSLMQYTGLKDKNGIDIYEGDIVSLWKKPWKELSYVARNYVVEWKQTNEQSGWNVVKAQKVEVIGNIFENPELLNYGRE